MKKLEPADMGKQRNMGFPHGKIETGGPGERRKSGYPHEKGSKTKKKGFAEKANPH